LKEAINGCKITDPEIDKVITYTICARRFGYTPQQVDTMDPVTLSMMIIADHRMREKENETP